MSVQDCEGWKRGVVSDLVLAEVSDQEIVLIMRSIMDTRIYVMTHKKYSKPDMPEYSMLQVGAALHDDLGYIADNTGDNISEKNMHYCELTGIYWLWKNVRCDIIGICHYRRYFIIDENFLKKDQAESILRDYDVILPNSQATDCDSLYEHYKRMHHSQDMDIIRDIICEKCPEYLNSFDFCMNHNLMSVGNMIVTGKEIFDRYCEWLFSILFEAEKRIDISGYDEYQSRVFGFLSERLLRVFFLHHRYRIKEIEMRMINPDDAENVVKAVGLKKQMVSIILHDLVQAYADGTASDLIDSRPLDVDFHGRTPVWILWLQGIENAPKLVQICVKSIERNIPSDKAEIRIITMDNLGQYVNLPDWVVKKFGEGKIALTHLSDIIRFGLLYRYGGMWMDSTYFMTEPFDESIWEPDVFYTPRMRKPKWRADVTQGRWSGNLMKGSAGDVIFRFMLNAFYWYWNIENQQIDYYLIDYIMNLAYENLTSVRQHIDACPYTQEHILDLQPLMNRVYKPDKWNELTSDTNVFKLSYKKELIEENLVGEKTFYGYCCSSCPLSLNP